MRKPWEDECFLMAWCLSENKAPFQFSVSCAEFIILHLSSKLSISSSCQFTAWFNDYIIPVCKNTSTASYMVFYPFLTSAKWLEKENKASYHIYWNWSSSRTSRSTSIPLVSGMCFCPHLTPLLLSGDQEDWRTMFITKKERTSPHRSGLRQRQEHPST